MTKIEDDPANGEKKNNVSKNAGEIMHTAKEHVQKHISICNAIQRHLAT